MQEVSNKQPTEKHNGQSSFYRTSWFVLITLLFATPLGVFLWFKYPKNPDGKAKKILKGITSAVLLFIWTSLVTGKALAAVWVLATALSLLVWFKFPRFKNIKTTKILKGIVLTPTIIVWLLLTFGAMTGFRDSETFSVGGSQVKIYCSYSCSSIDEYGESGSVKQLATIGVNSVDDFPSAREGSTVKISVDKELHDSIDLLLTYKNNKLATITNADYPSIVYYSSSNSEAIAPYPSKNAIAKEKSKSDARAEAASKAESKAKAEAEAKKAKEEEKRMAAEALIPTSVDTMSFCIETFHNRYPYKNSKVHSILGEIANDKHSSDSRFYKVEVTIQNAFGAEYGAVMECLVKKSGDKLSIESFNVY